MSAGEGVHFHDAEGPEGTRLYAIGDVHGRFDCLEMLHETIAREIERDRPADWRIVHLGDYVDRGPQSARVLDFLARRGAEDARILALAGNHDEGFLDFLADPARGRLFIDHGGFDTAASYGVVLDTGSPQALQASHRALVAAMPAAHLSFLRDLARAATFGDFFFCHAGVRPGVALDEQHPHDLIWIRGEFLHHQGLFEKVVVHGHTPGRAPEVMANRVNLDTMAYDSGRLTALVVEGREKRFLSTKD